MVLTVNIDTCLRDVSLSLALLQSSGRLRDCHPSNPKSGRQTGTPKQFYNASHARFTGQRAVAGMHRCARRAISKAAFKPARQGGALPQGRFLSPSRVQASLCLNLVPAAIALHLDAVQQRRWAMHLPQLASNRMCGANAALTGSAPSTPAPPHGCRSPNALTCDLVGQRGVRRDVPLVGRLAPRFGHCLAGPTRTWAGGGVPGGSAACTGATASPG